MMIELVCRLAYNGDVVAFKMGRRQGGPSRTGSRGRIPHHFNAPIWFSPARYKNGAGRNRRATQPPAHFQRNPPGRGRLAVFPRCSLDPYDSDMGALPPVRLGPRLEKQPTDRRQYTSYLGDRTLNAF